MSIIAFIPVRIGSVSIPKKNIKIFNGKPLIFWYLNSLQKSKNIDKIIVASDSTEINIIVNNFNFNKVSIYFRNPKNSRDESQTEDVMLEFIKNSNLKDDDIFLLCQVTNPFVTNTDIDKSLDLFLSKNYDSLLSCVRSKRFYWDDNFVPLNYNVSSRPLRQNFNGLLMENGAFYISYIKNIKKTKCRLSGNIGIYEMPEYSSVEIDEKLDWFIAEHIFKSQFKFNRKLLKLFFSDIDGTLTDGGMYYSNSGDELKKFNTKDGKGFEILKSKNIKVGLLTSENVKINENRAKKLNIDFLYQGLSSPSKLNTIKKICKEQNIDISQVAYIGDDINCIDVLKEVGFPACPFDASYAVKNVSGIYISRLKGGDGCVREFIDSLIFE